MVQQVESELLAVAAGDAASASFVGSDRARSTEKGLSCVRLSEGRSQFLLEQGRWNVVMQDTLTLPLFLFTLCHSNCLIDCLRSSTGQYVVKALEAGRGTKEVTMHIKVSGEVGPVTCFPPGLTARGKISLLSFLLANPSPNWRWVHHAP